MTKKFSPKKYLTDIHMSEFSKRISCLYLQVSSTPTRQPLQHQDTEEMRTPSPTTTDEFISMAINGEIPINTDTHYGGWSEEDLPQLDSS